MTLVLFDIDGTLLVTGGASSRCIRRAAALVLGQPVEEIRLTVGTLDSELFSELATGCGVAITSELLSRYRQLYDAELRQELVRCAANVKALPGARDLVRSLGHMTGVSVGLLTGNWRQIAEMKLRAAGFDLSGFSIGAFAGDGSTRSELVDVAITQAREVLGHHCTSANVILVGDTPRDVACAKSAGCRVISVATGHYSIDELQTHQPDLVVPDLTHTDAILDLIGRQ